MKRMTHSIFDTFFIINNISIVAKNSNSTLIFSKGASMSRVGSYVSVHLLCKFLNTSATNNALYLATRYDIHLYDIPNFFSNV